jgi:5'-nucleotidase / UDP-sugar diphosphatase
MADASTVRGTLLPFLIAAVLAVTGAIASAQQTRELVILHDTHLHGKFGPEDGANIARYATLVRELSEGRDDVLFVGNGDDLATSLLASVYRGEHMIEALNLMGIDFNTLGNHDFDYGPDNLLEQLARSSFGWVSGNIIDARTGDAFGAEHGVARYVVHEMPSGLLVGITGFAPPDTPEVTTLGEHARMVDVTEAATELVASMRAEGAHVVLVLSHLCWPDAERLAREVDGITAIVGDHCATVLEQPEVVGSTILSRVGDEFDHLGELTLVMADAELVDWRFTLHDVTVDIEQDPDVLALVARYEDALDAAMGETIGETAVALDVRRSAVRSEETNIGNFITDVIRDWADADVAMYNGGSIRADRIIEPGPLTIRDVIETLPFENHIVKLELTGQTLLEVLELSVSSVEEGHGRFMQVSGLSFTFDPAAEPGARVREVLVGAEPLDPDRTYTLATNNFIADGGDGYDMLVAAPRLIDHLVAAHDVDLIDDAIRTGSPIAPELEGRIRTAP